MDAILVGSGTARTDDPRLTARPPGPRTATRIVLDTQASLPLESQLVQSVGEGPVIVAAADSAPASRVARLREAGVEVLLIPTASSSPTESVLRPRLNWLLEELGRRWFTNLLVEGGGELLGAFFDAGLIDEVHVFVGPKLVGGATAPSPLGGLGIPCMSDALPLLDRQVELLEGDVYLRGRLHEDVCEDV
jgi:diaminohydroxyphosphoribosylaminopyrimidine deaminase/5-amino-6-(5-phosphoribosylamino)uracil reductase